MSKNYRVKVNNSLGATSATILENIHQLVKRKPDRLKVNAGKNGLANGTIRLNQAKKIVTEIKKKSQNTKINFSSIIIQKDRKNIDKKVLQEKSNLKNSCNQKI